MEQEETDSERKCSSSTECNQRLLTSKVRLTGIKVSLLAYVLNNILCLNNSTFGESPQAQVKPARLPAAYGSYSTGSVKGRYMECRVQMEAQLEEFSRLCGEGGKEREGRRSHQQARFCGDVDCFRTGKKVRQFLEKYFFVVQ